MILSRRNVLFSSAAAAVAACSSAPVPVDTYYRLDPVTPPPSAMSLKGAAEVAPLRGEGVINGRAIVYRRAAQLQQYSYHFWSDTPASMLQRNLVDALRTAKAFDTVATPDMRLDRAYEIVGMLRKLEHDQSGSQAVMELELGLRKVAGNRLLLLNVYDAQVPTSGSGVPAVIAAFSAAQSQIFGRFLADLAQIRPE